MKKALLVAVAIASLSGCVLTGGNVDYTVKPVINEVTGEVICCEAEVYNSKDYDKLELLVEKGADGSITVKLKEEGVSASDPAAVAAANNAKMLEMMQQLIPAVLPTGPPSG